MNTNMFDRQKKDCLSASDLSRKGSVDAPIEDLIDFINNQADFFTTSSCSGRIIVVDNDAEGKHRKQGCKWILTSHDLVTAEQLKHSLKDIQGNAVFKFEPFVLHVQCRSLENAQLMLSSGVGSGFRNSGISVGNKGKFITAIRSTHSLEVPLAKDGQLLVSEQYLEYIVELANNKMANNFEKIQRFFDTLKTSLHQVNISAEKALEKQNKKLRDQQHRLDHVQRSDIDTKSTVEAASDRDDVEDLVQCAIFTCDLDT